MDKTLKEQAKETVADVIKTVAIDLLQPSSKELGDGLGTIALAINKTLLPFRVYIWGIEALESLIKTELPKKLQHIPAVRLVPTPPMIAGPTLEALKFAAAEPSLRELYLNLLAASMDSETAREAHPAFVEIIRQLSSDEAKILKTLSHKPVYPLIAVTSKQSMWPAGNIFEPPPPMPHFELGFRLDCQYFSTLPFDSQCEFPDLAASYFDNLIRLGLVEVFWNDCLPESEAYDAITRHEKFEEIAATVKAEKRDMRTLKSIVALTSFGAQFCSTCVCIEGSRVHASKFLRTRKRDSLEQILNPIE